MIRTLRALAATACLGPLAAMAHLIDDAEIRRVGNDTVLQLRLVTGVQLQRSVVAASGDQALVFYRVLPTRQALQLETGQRRLPARGGLPGVTVIDEAGTGRTADERRLLVRLDRPLRLRVRSGRGDRSIELVLEGVAAAPAQAPAAAASAPVAEEMPYRVTLQASQDAGAYLSAPIPAALQNTPVFTTRRVIDGQVRYETHLGPFTRRAEAEAALAVLRPRFPQAQVTRSEPEVAAVAAAPGAPASAASAPTIATGAPAAAEPAPPSDAEIEQRARTLLASAREALGRSDTAAAIDALSQLLDLPPNTRTRPAQALIGQARQRAGDTTRARAEYELFLRLYPIGPDSQEVRSALATLRPPEPVAAAPARPTRTTTLTGSASLFFYGGASKVRTQEFQDSPIGGLPELVSDATLSSNDQRQLATSVDVNWRDRSPDADQRFVLRDTYTRDQLRPEKSRNRLSALYYDRRGFGDGTHLRIGRQSPQGGGVLGRFDGVQAGYTFAPRWRAQAVAGMPADTLLDTNRHFVGASVEGEALLPQLGGSLYTLEQKIDGQTDRRAVGTELRWLEGGLSANLQLDHDLVLRGLNIASLQATWQRPDNTVVNVLFDRRKTPLLALGNTLFFASGLAVQPRRIGELVDLYGIDTLRDLARQTAADTTQGTLGFTTPLNTRWQLGADLRYTSTGALAPVPDLLPQGQPASGDIWSLGLQAIGSNLYSTRDTHVFMASWLQGPTFQGQLLSYNNSTLVGPGLQLEPSLRVYRQTSNSGAGGDVRATRWTPGLRVSWRVLGELALESELSLEYSRTASALRNESSTRTFYYLGGRYEF